MANENIFRLFFAGIVLAAVLISGYFRRRARQSGDTISRVGEGRLTLLGRPRIVTPLLLSIIAYILNPEWMAWSTFPVHPRLSR